MRTASDRRRRNPAPNDNPLLRWRLAQKLRQVDVSAGSGIPQSYISRYERGVTPIPEVALRLEEYTRGGVPVSAWPRRCKTLAPMPVAVPVTEPTVVPDGDPPHVDDVPTIDRGA